MESWLDRSVDALPLTMIMFIKGSMAPVALKGFGDYLDQERTQEPFISPTKIINKLGENPVCKLSEVDTMDDKVKQMFKEELVDFQALAAEFTGLANYFMGTKPGKINRYDNGVMSVVIEGQNKDSPSTFGYFPPGSFKFNVGGNRETMHFLHGELEWGVGSAEIAPGQYDTLVIPAGQDLILEVKKPSLYVCDYVKE